MEQKLGEIIDRFFRLGDEGEDKVTSLEQAIGQNVKPGMVLHLGREPNAAIRQILRQFWGKNPRFTLVSGSIRPPYARALVYYNMVDKVITSASVDAYDPASSPSWIAGAFPAKSQKVETENWSLCSIEQRLMAGALGTGFMPTRSIVGSEMAEENRDSFQTIDDPFDSGKKIGIVKALLPDLSIVHGCIADRYGNTILPSPYSDTIWGPRASKHGVVVTVEKIVPTDFIREHPSLVKLPGYLVKAVCLAPLGAHPIGIVNHEVKTFEGYETDYDFLTAHAKAATNHETLDAWIKEWVLDCPSHEDYLSKIGHERTSLLKVKAGRDAWKNNISSVSESISTDEKYNPDEMMIVVAARELKKKVVENGYRTILSGAGTLELASWLAYYWLREEGYGLDLLCGLGQMGYMPLPGQTDIISISHASACKVLTDTTEIYSVVVGGENAKCLSVLGALQIDKFGNINNSRVGKLSIGSGGAGDAINASETVVVVSQSTNRLVERVPYITCPGDRIRMLVSSMGVFEKIGKDKEFTLVAYFPNSKLPSVDEKVRAINKRCGWKPRVAEKLREIAPPTREELMLLRLLGSSRSIVGARPPLVT